MHLLHLLDARARTADGVYLSLTQKCPLRCAHCSTSSDMRGTQIGDRPYIEFVESMAGNDPPSIVFLTGGEPLLRPTLIRQVAAAVHGFGSTVVALTGAFFLRRGAQIPRDIDEVIGCLDHLMISMDQFHDREVPRSHVLAALPELADRLDVSVQITGTDVTDLYLRDLIEDVRVSTQDRVPILVGVVSATGRGADVPGAVQGSPAGGQVLWPCHLMSWPVFTWNGHVTACCDQRVVSGPAPDHLSLHRAGEPARWSEVRATLTGRPLLRAIRTYGPGWVHEKLTTAPSTANYCGTCRALHHLDPGSIELWTRQPSFAPVEQEVERLRGAALPYVLPEFSDLAELSGIRP